MSSYSEDEVDFEPLPHVECAQCDGVHDLNPDYQVDITVYVQAPHLDHFYWTCPDCGEVSLVFFGIEKMLYYQIRLQYETAPTINVLERPHSSIAVEYEKAFYWPAPMPVNDLNTRVEAFVEVMGHITCADHFLALF